MMVTRSASRKFLAVRVSQEMTLNLQYNVNLTSVKWPSESWYCCRASAFWSFGLERFRVLLIVGEEEERLRIRYIT
jgi:hypothetical protein